MKKSIFILTGLLATALIGGCNAASDKEKGDDSSSKPTISVPENPKGTVDVEYGQDVSLLQYFEEGDSLITARLLDSDGKEIPLKNGRVNFQTLGTYKLVLGDGDTYTLVVKDTQGPVISRQTVEQYYYVDYEYDLGILCLDAKDGAVAGDTKITYKSDGSAVELVNGKFKPNKEGEYEISCAAKDGAGNESKQTFLLTARKYYAPALSQNFKIQGTHGAPLSQDFTVIDEKRYEVTKSTGDTIAEISLEGEGLDAHTVYKVTADYRVENYVPDPGYEDLRGNTPFEIYLSHAWEKFIVGGNGEGSFTFEITTDETGHYLWTYPSMKFWGEMQVTWLNFEFEKGEKLTHLDEYTFGNHTIRIEQSPDRSNFVSAERQKADGSKYFETRLLEFKEGGYEYLTLSGRGLEPNKMYTFVIDYDWEYSSSQHFAYYILFDGNLAVDIFKGYKTEDAMEYTVTTDKNGEYSVQYKHLCIAQMCHLKWLGIRDKADDYAQTVAKPAGTAVVLNDKTNDLGLEFKSNVISVSYDVQKRIAETTTMGATPVALTGNQFTVEAGAYYDVNITATTATGVEKKYVCVHDENIIVVSDKTSGFYNGSTLISSYESDEYGKKSYQLSAENASLGLLTPNKTALRVYGNGLQAGMAYTVYADITHSWDAHEGGSWVLQKSTTEYLDVQATRRGYKLADISGNGEVIFTTQFWAARLDNLTGDRTITFSNIVLIPQEYDIPSASLTKAVGTEITLDGKTNDLGISFYAPVQSVSYEVKKTVGNATTMGSAAVDLTSKKFTVEEGCFYDVNITITTASATIKKYVCVQAEGIIVVNSNESGFYKGSDKLSQAVTDEYGKRSYVLDSSVSSNGTLNPNVGELRVYNDGNGMQMGKQYKVYVDIVHSWDAAQGDSWVLQKSASEYLNVRETRRYFDLLDISGGGAVIYKVPFQAARLGNLTGDRSITVRNIVLVEVTA